MSVKIKDDKKLWNQLAQSMKDIAKNGNHVEAGVFGSQGSDLVIYAASNEFGVPGKIPERSFLRGTYDINKEKIYRHIKKKKLDFVLKGTSFLDKELKRIGEMFVGMVRKRIAARDFVPNAPSTIRGKKSDTPLIDTGRLRQSITYRLAR